MDRRTIVFVVLMTVSFYVINHFLFPSKPLPTPTVEKVEKVLEAPDKTPQSNEKYYVIQNNFQQLVISSLNGAIAEINLPLESPTNTSSVVKKIWVDDVMQNASPDEDYFPAGPYQTFEGSFGKGELGNFYPLIRRDVEPAYYTLATTTSNPSSADSEYTLVTLEKNRVVMEGVTGGVTLRKTYVLPDTASDTPYTFEYTVEAKENPGDLFLSTGIPEVELISGSSMPSIKYRTIDQKNRSSVSQISLPKESTTFTNAKPEWVSNSNGFFAILLDPINEMSTGFTASKIPGASAPTRLTFIDADINKYPEASYPGYDLKIPFKNQSGSYKFRVFAGPLSTKVLEANDARIHENYKGMQSFHGWFSFISEPFAKFLFFLMKIFYSAIHSWGFSIILLTIALRIMMYPLNAWSIKSTMKMQKLSPKLSALQERYKKDPDRLKKEMMAFYKEHGFNPLGGCFPLLIQMPFLIGMFDLLKSSFELRGVSFIPGWINNLTAPDVIFTWKTPIWIVGNSFHLLPILLGVVMYFQMRLSATMPKNPKQMTDQQKQQRLMNNMMTLVFTLLFYNFPSGLNIYWLSSMLLAILQQWWMTRKGKVA